MAGIDGEKRAPRASHMLQSCVCEVVSASSKSSDTLGDPSASLLYREVNGKDEPSDSKYGASPERSMLWDCRHADRDQAEATPEQSTIDGKKSGLCIDGWWWPNLAGSMGR